MTRIRNREGFTLIELIMVMVILGILAAVAVPKFFDFGSKAHEKNKAAVVGRVKSGLNNYAADKLVNSSLRTYPTAGTLTFAKILDETPDDWSITNLSGKDSLVYAGDNSSWEYTTSADSVTYTLTAQ